MNKEFQVHLLNDLGKVNARIIAEAFDELLEKLSKVNPDASRESTTTWMIQVIGLRNNTP